MAEGVSHCNVEEVKNTGLFVNKHQLKTALEREWGRREVVDRSRIQYWQKHINACADKEDKQMSSAKVENWINMHQLSDNGSVSSYEKLDKPE
ncbi:hypothetical protein QQF64_030803 [Cirrhinus molitorella]|uniref:Uncharacterized protein n=1 Tax=Cirrhinus molitorella TaxID=172907 RepID=A0ABR3N4D7_9TELE